MHEGVITIQHLKAPMVLDTQHLCACLEKLRKRDKEPFSVCVTIVNSSPMAEKSKRREQGVTISKVQL